MIIEINKTNSFFIFDLDDTLYQEIDYLKSAYKAIAGYMYTLINQDIYDIMLHKYHKNEDVFLWIEKKYPDLVSKTELLNIYRTHTPHISLSKDTSCFLTQLYRYEIPMGIISDGRSVTQWNKLRALNIDKYFKDIIISEEFGSEKPDIRNFKYYSDKYREAKFFFFGDNLNKDFIVPIELGWKTFCLIDKGENIHKQQKNNNIHNSIIYINSFNDINLVYKKII
ncbi:HAD family hydrolase [Viscerimonas tarda]